MQTDRQRDIQKQIANLSPHAELVSASCQRGPLDRFRNKFGMTSMAFAFTLAEVLITLGIIGVIAALVIPNLISNYQKHVTVVKLKSSYTILYQAINLSIADNGPLENWDFGVASSGDSAATLAWVKKYISPYVKNSEVSEMGTDDWICLKLIDGIDIVFHRGDVMDIRVYLNGYEHSKILGKDIFYFELVPNNPPAWVVNPLSNKLRAYDSNTTGVDREKWTTGTYACNKNVELKFYCSGLIMYDGWKIADDYPW